MVGSEDAFGVGEDLLSEGDCLVDAPGLPVGDSETVAGSEGVGVLGSEDAFAVGEDLLVEVDGVVEAPILPVGDGEAVAASEGVRVVGSEEICAVGGHALPVVRGGRRQASIDEAGPGVEEEEVSFGVPEVLAGVGGERL